MLGLAIIALHYLIYIHISVLVYSAWIVWFTTCIRIINTPSHMLFSYAPTDLYARIRTSASGEYHIFGTIPIAFSALFV